jgi:hypothetical protein
MKVELDITPQQLRVLAFALSRFIMDAEERAKAAAQDKAGRWHKPGAYAAFKKNCDDALDVYKQLPPREYAQESPQSHSTLSGSIPAPGTSNGTTPL